jgi:hypothetical protein
MTTLELTDDEATALAAHLRQAIAGDPFPLSPRLRPLRAILAKLFFSHGAALIP